MTPDYPGRPAMESQVSLQEKGKGTSDTAEIGAT